MALTPIFASFLEDRARSGSTDNCVNLYPEKDADESINSLLGDPGLGLALTVGTGPIRGMYLAGDGLMYVVSGAQLWSIASTNTGAPVYTTNMIGTINSSTGSVYMVDNPTQLMLVDGVYAWMTVKGSDVLTQIIPRDDISDMQPSVVVYQDGFGIVNSVNSNLIYQSNYNDFSTWSVVGAPNDAFVQGDSDPVVTMYDLKREVWIFKPRSIEVWINQGSAGFAFTPLQGVFPPVGCGAPNSVCRIGENVAWLGNDNQGNSIVYMSNGYQATQISTYSLTALFNSYPTTEDAIAYSHQWDAHNFYVLTFPTQNVTFVFDITTRKWHQRAYFENGSFSRELPFCFCQFNGLSLTGDYSNGNIYFFSDSIYTHNGNPIKWLRQWRALPPDQPKGVPMSFDQLQILMETGITAAAGTNPQIMLRWSDDGGYTFPGQVMMSAGQTGQTAWRVIQNRLGSTKIGTGLDRVFEISSIDSIRVSITGADLEAGPA
jgi:hypothetical protein